MAITSAVGLGSGLNIGEIVSQLVAAEGQAKFIRLDQREARIQARVSALGAFKSALSEFKSSIAKLGDVSTFQSTSASSGDRDQFTVSAQNGAAAGSYSVEVSALAEAHTLTTSAANAKTNITDTVGTGTLTFDFGGGTTKTVTITDGSLSSIRDAINDANIGVSATLINDGTGYRLSLKSDTGLDNSMKITVADDDTNDLDDAGLSILAYDPAGAPGAGKNMDETNAAADATFVVDGIAITSASNTITSVIDDVTINLVGISTGTAGTLTVSQSTSSAKTAITEFKDAFNSLATALNEMSFYDDSTGQSGILAGDALIRNAESNLRNIMNQSIGGFSATYDSLAMLGFRTNRDGTFELDSTLLDDALAKGIGEVQSLFSGGNIGGTTQLADLSANYVSVPTGIDPTELDIEITQQATQGSYTSTITGPFTISSGIEDGIVFEIDGVATGEVALDRFYNGGNYDPAVTADTDHLVATLQAGLDADANLVAAGVTATVSFNSATNELTITSDSYGSTSEVNITSLDIAFRPELGMTVSSGVAGVDVEGTIDGDTGVGTGRFLAINAGALAGLNIEVLGGEYSQDQIIGGREADGLIAALDEMLDNYISFDGIIESSTTGYNEQIERINQDRETLNRRLESLETRLMAQYSAMDALVGQLNATSGFLAQQLANLPSTSSKK